MGLGPPICLECGLVFAFDHTTNDWYCLKCGETEVDKCLWDVDNFNEYVENTKKYIEETNNVSTG